MVFDRCVERPKVYLLTLSNSVEKWLIFYVDIGHDMTSNQIQRKTIERKALLACEDKERNNTSDNSDTLRVTSSVKRWY